MQHRQIRSIPTNRMDYWITSSTMAAIPMQSNYGPLAPVNGSINEDQKTFNFSQYPALRNFEGHIDPDYVKLINPFWLKFDPPSRTSHYALGMMYVLLTIVGCSGNGFVIFMFLRCKSLRTPANKLVLNLAVSDLFMTGKSWIAAYDCFHCGPALGRLWCKIYAFIGGLTGTASITTLTAISIDRYNVVVYPLNPLKSTTNLRFRIMIALIWCYSLFFAIMPALDIGLSDYVPEGYLTTCSFDYLSKERDARIFMLCYWIAAWCVPFVVITYCYFYIFRVVVSANSIQSSKDKNKTEVKLAMVIIAVIALWFLAWTPYSIVALLGITGNESALTPFTSIIPALFCKSAGAINPYVYAVTHPRFRLELSRLFCKEAQPSLRRASTYQSSTFTRSSTHRRVAPEPNELEPKITGRNEEMRIYATKGLERSDTVEDNLATTMA